MAHILLVEDNFSLRLSLSASLRAQGWEISAAASAEEGAHAAEAHPPDLAVLDWMLPGKSGVELLAEWRAAGRGWPVILLTARDEVADRVRGLESGADDYVVKPFATEELIARIRARLRARPAAASRVLRLTGCEVDLDRLEIRRGAERLPLTTREADLLAYLAHRAGQDVPRDDLLREVWGYRGAVVTRSVDNAVLRLRAKLEGDPARPRHLLTAHGVGYRLQL